jgi:hypothetical protein
MEQEEKERVVNPDVEEAVDEGQSKRTGISSGDDSEKLDLLPEFCQYRDEGCKLSRSCLGCPFPQCIHDRPFGRGKQELLKKARNLEIIREFASGKTQRELALTFNISIRTVKRALRRNIND